jgi:putative chitobiose transport system permease protein
MPFVSGRAAHRPGKSRWLKGIKRLMLYLVLIMVAILCAGPFLWMISTSFKGNENVYEMYLIPKFPTLDNYIGVVQMLEIHKYFLNTIFLTGVGIFLDVLLATLCAYPLAKLDFYGKKLIMGVLVATQILPASAGMIVNYLTISSLGLVNTFAGVILPGATGIFSIILFRQAYLSVPNETLESARIDGASDLRIWANIMLPFILPAIATIVIFDFIAKWNSFLWPMIILMPAKFPIATMLNYLSNSFNYNFKYVVASTVLSVIPVVIVFIACQKSYINTVAGAIK